jgi:hypothetical protein
MVSELGLNKVEGKSSENGGSTFLVIVVCYGCFAGCLTACIS